MKKLFNVVFGYEPNEEIIESSKFDTKYVFVGYEDYHCGDCVITDTRNGFVIGRIIGEIDKPPRNLSGRVMKEIVCKVDFKAFYKRKEVEEKRKEIERKLKERAKYLQGVALWEMLAKEDESMKELLDQYKGLDDE